MVYVNATKLAHIMTTMLTENERYKKLGDVIEHAKKCGAYDFHSALNLGQADK